MTLQISLRTPILKRDPLFDADKAAEAAGGYHSSNPDMDKWGYPKGGMTTMAKQGFFSEHWNDKDNNPGGGVTSGRGMTISWQNGPLGKIGTDERRESNGAFVEDVIAAAIERIAFYQNGKFHCEENATAILHLQQANKALDSRTKRRVADETEGTHSGH